MKKNKKRKFMTSYDLEDFVNDLSPLEFSSLKEAIRKRETKGYDKPIGTYPQI